ncbi:MAG TPA: aspartate-semialdehyde dehydrogenase [Candidatus Latescibacteria bacterium]|jgi:aspartate-semialdehyde dehydrogenase|nr:aspartate-semialdehyde dehydrogenase [Gemmatimonadaceae bacterium]MDP6017437.1 aspartate-semialdehyde dehydrogenase [Candidatus Latescibacterota bacterium]HJP30904.1 aspartate-semialdehyde dehydrogenase [Candidatus Latescibacterota bacterium]
MSDRYNVAIMGATGAVGQIFLELLAERDFPMDELRPLASSRSAGKELRCGERTVEVQELTRDSFDGIDIVLSSAGGELSKEFVPAAVEAGAVVVDNTSAFRMDDDVPLVVPEVNPEDLDGHNGIIANPNCSTIIMVVPLWPLYQQHKVRRVVVSTYQAISGAGAKAMAELETQTRDVLAGNAAQPCEVPHQIAFNLFSHNSAIGADGYCEEETKMIRETRKMFHDDGILVTPTCIRVPILRAHSEAMNIEFVEPVTAGEVSDILAQAPGVAIVDDREGNHFPMPLEASGVDDVLVGRIRQDLSRPDGTGVDLFLSGDQLRKGAALNAMQIAEVLVERGQLKSHAAASA